MHYLDKRVQVICENLKRLSLKQQTNLSEWKYKEGTYLTRSEADSDGRPWEDFDTSTMHWYGKDRHYWFHTIYKVPESFDGKNLWLQIKTQIDEWDDAKNPQFLLFVNGEVTQGLDMNHREVLLTKSAKAGEVISLDIQAYSGIIHSEFNFITQVFELDEKLNNLYWDLQVPLDAFPRMQEDTLDLHALTEALNSTVNFIDFRNPYSDEFYQSIQNAQEFIDKAIYTDLVGHSEIIASCIGHTHIDIAWWWTVAQTREKVCRSFSTVLKFMEEYPEYRFMSSQPLLYEFVKERYPEMYEKIKERIAEGRWEPEGGMWVEADCNLTSGESLVRQFLYGMDFFEKEFGVENKILWLPDVFGYSAALPQILQKCGIEYFMTTKINWNQFNKIPHDTFQWKGIDGTEVLTHMITTLGVNQDESSFFTTYNGMLHPGVFLSSWRRYQDKVINNDILIAYGYGDGGGGPTRKMLEHSKRLEKGIQGIPQAKQVFAREYFDKLKEKVEDHPRLATWEGELYFEYHRGTYTSMGRNKRSNRKSEFGLMDIEFLSVLCDDKVSYPKNELDSIWKVVLQNQFHDILPGSSIKEVYDDTKREYEEIEEQLESLREDRLGQLCTQEDGVTIINTTSFYRDQTVEIFKQPVDSLVDESGKVYPLQHTDVTSLIQVEQLPPKGFQTFSYGTESQEPESPFIITDSSIETPLLKVQFYPDGTIAQIYDLEEDRNIVKDGAKANLLRVFEDKPMYYDNWDIDIYYTEKSWDLLDLVTMEWVEEGPLRATLRVERSMGSSRIIQDVHFYTDTKRIDFSTYVDWQEEQHLLKVFFPTNIHSDEASFDIQFGNVTRKTHTNTSWDEARFESCGHKWIDVSEGHYGVSLLNDCKYGHSVHGGEMALTLIKSGIQPHPTTDQEEHIFTYALYPHAEGWKQGNTTRESYFLNQPVQSFSRKADTPSFCLAEVDKDNLILETIKRSEDGKGYILRIFENDKSLTKGTVTFHKEFTKASLCNLREKVIEELPCSGQTVQFTAKPFEIITIRVE